MKAYSLDLRQRVVTAYEAGGATIIEVAARFSVGETFVKKMLAQKRAHGTVLPPAHGGGKKRILEETHLRALHHWLAREPDLTLAELRAKLLPFSEQAIVWCWITWERIEQAASNNRRKLRCQSPLARSVFAGLFAD